MEQVGNIIQRKKLEPNVPKVDVSASNSAPNIGQNIAKALIAFHKTRPFVVEKSENSFFKNKKGLQIFVLRNIQLSKPTLYVLCT